MSDSYPASNLPWKKGFWCLMVTQTQNAFSDNALKSLIIYLLMSRLTAGERDAYVGIAGLLFSAPFILFSILGGWLADRYSKQIVLSSVKLAEIGIMLFAAVALGLENLWLELTAIFMMGCHSSIFGPSKYGILPEILPLDKLSWGNGLLELLTFLGIISGTVAGGLLKEHLEGRYYVAGIILLVLAVTGWVVSMGITRVPASDPQCPARINPVTNLWRQLKMMKPDNDLWRALWGNTGFWFVAMLISMNMIIYAKEVLNLTDSQNSYLNAALFIGIGIGSALAGVISRGKIEYGLVPLGAAGMALSAAVMGIPNIGTVNFSVCLVGLGLTAGLFIVPIAAALQHRPAPDRKGAVQGAANLLSFVGIAGASLAQLLLTKGLDVNMSRLKLHFFIPGLNLNSGQVFWFCGAAALFTGIYAAASRRGAVRNLLQSWFKGAS